MIEQTELIVSEWSYDQSANPIEDDEKIISYTSLEVMKKRAATKKGIACRLSASFINGNDTILKYVAADSYVIDLADKIDRNELLTMIRNSFSKFKEKFELLKLNTVLRNKSLRPLDEANIDLAAILPLLE